MRLFLAIELPDDVRRHVAGVQQMLGPRLGRASLPRERNLHVTLKFLGDVADADVTPLCAALGDVRSAGVISLQPSHLECFPPRGPVRVVAVGLTGTLEPLRALYDQIETACHERAIPRESRAYTPHITLARARNPLPPHVRGELIDSVASLFPGPAWAVEEFVLVQSVLRRQGAEYSTVARFGIASRGGP